MFSYNNYQGVYYCMSTDPEKPTTGFLNGDELREIDTAKTYHFDEDSATWIEWAAAAEEPPVDAGGGE